MRVSLITRFAIRALGRSPRRTLLSVLGVGVGCAVAIYIAAFMRGVSDLRIRAIADSGVGHLRVVPAAWDVSREDDLRLVDWRAELDAVRAVPGVRIAVPRARTMALLAFGTRSIGVELVGVDPPVEMQLNRLMRAVTTGRYLTAEDRGVTVIGSTIARRLEVETEDDLLLTVVRQGGAMEYGMLRIVGIVDTGSDEIDASICHVHLSDITELTGRDGAGEITVTVERPTRLGRMLARIADRLPEGDTVLPWQEVVPGIGGDARSDEAFMNLFVVVVALVVILGVTSAQLTGVLQRKREFAVLMALGMKGTQVVRLLFVEAAVVGILGSIAGLLLATPFVYYTATTGIDFAKLVDSEMTVSGVLYDPVFYADMGTWMIPYGIFVALLSTFVAALYPAWFAVQTDPTSALSLREA